MDYVDFDLAVEPIGDATCRVEVLRSPAGEVRATVALPASLASLSTRIRALVRASGNGRSRDLGYVPVKAVVPPSPASLQDCGRTLFETLMPSEVLACFRVSAERARSQGKGIRVRLRLDAPELAAVPWEYAYDPSVGDHI